MTVVRSTLRVRLMAQALSAAALLWLLAGCATVQPYQREHLSDRIMSFRAEAKEDARKTKSFDAREGSTGGNGGAGGGCACN